MAVRIRPGDDADAEQLIALIGACWALYPGIRMDMDGEMPELRALATYYACAGGALWVAEDGGTVVGMAATRPHDADAFVAAAPVTAAPVIATSVTATPATTTPVITTPVTTTPVIATPVTATAVTAMPVIARSEATRQSPAWEICRVYVHPSLHGSGLGDQLLNTAEAHAIAAGATRIVLWSDTRFDRAHRFYEKRSYVRAGPIRVLQDISHSLEFAYAKPVNAIEMLDAAAAASAERRLSDILIACVADGASVSFWRPLVPDVARAFWKRTTTDVAAGRQKLFCGWVGGVLAGTVTLHLGTPPNQPHRAEIQKLLVHPDARRHGLARALMQRAEREATRAGRSLLTLDTRAGHAAERLYRATGWHEAGRIPGYALNADGTPGDAVFFWKKL
jgi:GNAT superfamily N-acetyltransferase